MPDKSNNLIQDNKKSKNVNRGPDQVPPSDKHLGATADEDIPQDDVKPAGKRKEIKSDEDN
jgi:hypothetical protein